MGKIQNPSLPKDKIKILLLEGISENAAAVLQSAGYSNIERLTNLHESDKATILVTDELSGFCTVALDLRSVRFGQRAWVEDLAVDPTRRSEGAGKALLDAAKEWAVQHGASHLELDSGDARVDAHRFYDRETPSWTSRCYGWQL